VARGKPIRSISNEATFSKNNYMTKKAELALEIERLRQELREREREREADYEAVGFDCEF
jgi:hypothetical protein